jgi:hypothetical protein
MDLLSLKDSTFLCGWNLGLLPSLKNIVSGIFPEKRVGNVITATHKEI